MLPLFRRGLDQADHQEPHGCQPGNLAKHNQKDNASVYSRSRHVAPNFGLMLALLVAIGAWVGVGYIVAAILS